MSIITQKFQLKNKLYSIRKHSIMAETRSEVHLGSFSEVEIFGGVTCFFSLVILQAPTKQERSNRHQLLGDIVNNYTRAQIIGSSNPILFDLFKLATSDPAHPVYIAIGSVQNPTDRL